MADLAGAFTGATPRHERGGALYRAVFAARSECGQRDRAAYTAHLHCRENSSASTAGTGRGVPRARGRAQDQAAGRNSPTSREAPGPDPDGRKESAPDKITRSVHTKPPRQARRQKLKINISETTAYAARRWPPPVRAR